MKSTTVLTAALAAILAAPPAGASEVAVPSEPTVVVMPVPTLAPVGQAPAIPVPAPTLAPVPGPTTVVETPGASTVTVTCPPTQIIVVPPPPPPVVVMSPPVIVAPPQTCPACTPPPPPPPPPPPRPVPTTELHFTSNDDEEYIISIYREDPVWDYEAQCMTPCVLHVPNGTYEFMAGYHRTFQVYAIGGAQSWLVEDNSGAGIVLGSILTGVGGIAGFMGALFLDLTHDSYDYDDRYGSSDESDYNETAAIATGVGFGSAVLGFTIWMLSYGMAEMVLPSDGTIPLGAGLGVLPTLTAGRGEAGEDRFALGLALRF